MNHRQPLVLCALLPLLACGGNGTVTTEDTATMATNNETDGVTDSGAPTASETTPESTDPLACLDDPDAGAPGGYGNACTAIPCYSSTDCCPGTHCSLELLTVESGHSEGRCYPKCRAGDEAAPCCAAGDRCLAFDSAGTKAACVATGYAKKRGLSLKVLPRGTDPGMGGDVSYTVTDAVLDGKKLALNMAIATVDQVDLNLDGTAEDVLIIVLEGVANAADTWLLTITVPVENWKAGVFETRFGAETSAFTAELIRFRSEAQLWLEAVAESGTLEITAPGAVCEKAPCSRLEAAVDLRLLALHAALSF